MSEWTNLIIALVVISVIIAICINVVNWRYRLRRERYLLSREPMSDIVFTKALRIKNPVKARLAIKIRMRVGCKLNLPPQMIHPSDSIYMLISELRGGTYLLEVGREVMKEEAGGVITEEQRWELKGAEACPISQETFGEFVQWYLEHM